MAEYPLPKWIIMYYGMLVFTVVLLALQNISTKQYSEKRTRQNVYLYMAVNSFTAMLFFCICAGFRLELSTEFLLYSVLFALCMGGALISSIYAIKSGPLSITALISSYSLILSTMYGVIVLKEEVRLLACIGFGLLLFSLFLINIKKEEMRFSPIWIVCVILLFVTNGMCSVVQKMQQIACGGAYKNEFMIVAMLMVTVVFLAISLIRAPKEFGEDLKNCMPYAVIQGGANGAVNLFVIILVGVLPNSIVFPLISAGGIVVQFFVSVFFYKENLSKAQYIGFIAGIASVVLLNL